MTLLDRLLVKTSPQESGCWTWTGSLGSHGYGQLAVNGKPKLAHRVAYEQLVGPVPDGLELDHLCRNTACVNPKHLEPVTHAENIRRSDVALGIRSAATHCANGHGFTPENTVPRKRNGSVHRVCRTCKSESRRRRSRLKKAQVQA